MTGPEPLPPSDIVRATRIVQPRHIRSQTHRWFHRVNYALHPVPPIPPLVVAVPPGTTLEPEPGAGPERAVERMPEGAMQWQDVPDWEKETDPIVRSASSPIRGAAKGGTSKPERTEARDPSFAVTDDETTPSL